MQVQQVSFVKSLIVELVHNSIYYILKQLCMVLQKKSLLNISK